MIIYKEKLEIELEEDTIKLKKEILQLKKLREEIIKSSSYLLLDGKTQMIDRKEEIEIRSRLEHSNNVAKISKKIIGKIYDLCSSKTISTQEIFKLNKERAGLYAEITALAHDLGHTPFGHNGEVVVNEFIQSIEDKEVISRIIERRIKCFGEEYEEEQGHTTDFDGRLSFEHNEQSAIEFARIVNESTENYEYIDVKKIIIGILSHSMSRVQKVPNDLIAQIVRQTDKIEYRNKDYEEIRKYIKFNSYEDDLFKYQSLSVEQRINQIIEAIANEAIEKGMISDDNDALEICKKFRKKYENVVYFLGEDGKRGLISGDNRERQQMICKKLLEYYYQHPEKIPTKSMSFNYPINTSKTRKRVVAFDKTKLMEESTVEKVIKYVNSFTNKKCMNMYIRLVKERAINGPGYGIEPIKEEEIEERKKMQIEEQVSRMRGQDVYKGIQMHTDQEYVNMLRRKNYKFFERDITDEAKEVIKQNRKKHEKENDEDKTLWSIIKKADMERIIKGLFKPPLKRIEMKEKKQYEKELEM